jgi:hypothetical protein
VEVTVQVVDSYVFSAIDKEGLDLIAHEGENGTVGHEHISILMKDAVLKHDAQCNLGKVAEPISGLDVPMQAACCEDPEMFVRPDALLPRGAVFTSKVTIICNYFLRMFTTATAKKLSCKYKMILTFYSF